MAVIRDEEYAVVVERERPLLQACAYLLTADEGRADRLVQLVLARMYERWDDVRRPRVEALRALVQTSPHDPMLPWDTGPRVQLVDGGWQPAPAPEIVRDLQRLPPDQRAVIVLERYAELPSVQIAEVCDRTVDEVLVLARQARAALGVDHPDRAEDAVLAEELREAIPLDRRTAYDGAVDLDHGRHLVRRRWLRRGLAAAVAAVLLGTGIVFLLPDRAPAPVAAPVPAVTPTPTPTPTAISANCETTDPICRGEILRRWRAEMAVVVGSYLDPEGRYFSGYGYRYDKSYDDPGFWTGQGGALAFEMFRLDRGATTVYVQIATSRQQAVRCGETVARPCTRQKFLDGNFFNLTTTVNVRQGMEVQHRPTGQHVVTVIARNTTRGQDFDLERGDLIRLVQDPRLRLPEI
ncbi:MAG TPA: sigma factor-like helix-turn-helix DNA-binding protein [Propionibacteriaceae bacterium]|nr:sigma factor-like helix-turn-helix DNA-binding protein [Propionibacteriaceae bacterium]